MLQAESPAAEYRSNWRRWSFINGCWMRPLKYSYCTVNFWKRKNIEPSGITSSCSFWHFCSLSHSTPCFGPHARRCASPVGLRWNLWPIYEKQAEIVAVWQSAWRQPSQIAFVIELPGSFLGLVVNFSQLVMQRLPKTLSSGGTPVAGNFYFGPRRNQSIQFP